MPPKRSDIGRIQRTARQKRKQRSQETEEQYVSRLVSQRERAARNRATQRTIRLLTKIPQARPEAPKRIKPRFSRSVAQLTRRFMNLIKTAPEGVLDLNEVSRMLGVQKQRVYDITNVLAGIPLIRKKSKNFIQWIGSDIKNITKRKPEHIKLKDEVYDLSVMEAALDELIKDCAHQLFDLTDDKENARLAYVTYQDICSIQTFQEQIVIAVKAPEETKMEVPAPKEDCIKVHLRSTKGPIDVYLCEVPLSSPDGDALKNTGSLSFKTK